VNNFDFFTPEPMNKKTNQASRLLFRIRFWLVIFIAGLFLSGITAFPIETQLRLLMDYRDCFPGFLSDWLQRVTDAVISTNRNYPFLSYGTDWLAFAHIVIAIAFIGPLRDPLKNIWVVQFGMISCAMVIPLALIAGYIREIPLFWRIIDCSFGVIGIVPLVLAYRGIRKMLDTNRAGTDQY
jgi:hypothetical protein